MLCTLVMSQAGAGWWAGLAVELGWRLRQRTRRLHADVIRGRLRGAAGLWVARIAGAGVVVLVDQVGDVAVIDQGEPA